MLSKKERRRQKAKERKAKEADPVQAERTEPEDEEERQLVAYLQNWSVEEEKRYDCRVEEAWLEKMRNYRRWWLD